MLLVPQAKKFLAVATDPSATDTEQLLARARFGLVVAVDALLLDSLRLGEEAAKLGLPADVEVLVDVKIPYGAAIGDQGAA